MNAKTRWSVVVSILICCSLMGIAYGEGRGGGGSIGLNAVRDVAGHTSRNAQGYWEADFEGAEVMIHVPAGPFVMGYEGEGDAEPVREVTLDDYWIAKYPVTVAQFRRFVEETGYRTDAEPP